MKKPPQPVPAARPEADRGAVWRLVSMLLLALAVVIASLGAGMPDDRVVIAGASASILACVAFPLAGLLIVAATACGWRATSPRLRPTPLVYGAGLLAACALASAAFSPYRWLSPVVLAVIVAALFAGALAALLARDRTAAFGLIAALWLAGLLVAAVGLREYLMNWLGGRHNWRVFGPFADPNFLAGYLVLTLPVAAGVFLTAARRSLAGLAFLALLMQAGCLLETQSRLGIAALLVGLIVFAVLMWRSGAFHERPVRRRFVALLACAVIAAAVFARPVLGRLRASAGEAYSARFRLLTWSGTERMANAHPVLGVGPGAFPVAYPRYAEVGWTEHAHNTYVQLASEIGYPGVLGFLALLAGVLASGTLALRRLREAEALPAVEVSGGAAAVMPRRNGRSAHPQPVDGHLRARFALHDLVPHADQRVLIAALLGAIAAAIVHDLFDSDLYVPAVALVFAVVCGLAVSLPPETDEQPAKSEQPARPDRPAQIITALGGIALVIVLVPALIGRLYAQQAVQDGAQGDYATAADAYRAAISADPWNANYELQLADVLEHTSSMPDALAAYRRAIALVPSAKALRRYGKLLAYTGDQAGALQALEKARRADPHDLQTLLALAQQYEVVGRHADALAVYRAMAAQQNSLVGQVRAVPELVDWEYGAAHLALAQDAVVRKDFAAAEPEFRQAVLVLGLAWATRNSETSLARPGSAAVIRGEVAPRLDSALEGWATALDALGKHAQAADARARLAKFRREREADQQAPPLSTP